MACCPARCSPLNLTVILLQVAEHHCARRHIQAHGKRLCCEQHFDQAFLQATSSIMPAPPFIICHGSSFQLLDHKHVPFHGSSIPRVQHLERSFHCLLTLDMQGASKKHHCQLSRACSSISVKPHLEQNLNQLLEYGQQPTVMDADASLQHAKHVLQGRQLPVLLA